MRQLAGSLQQKFPNEKPFNFVTSFIAPASPSSIWILHSHQPLKRKRSHNYSVQRSLAVFICDFSRMSFGPSAERKFNKMREWPVSDERQQSSSNLKIYIRNTRAASSNEIILLQFALIQCTSSGDASVSIPRPCASRPCVTALVNGQCATVN